MLTQERLKDVLHYDESTGIFTWRVALSRRVRIGDVAGTVTNRGYITIKIDGRLYRAHRIAWLYVHGTFPPDQIDHIDHRRANNSIANLRLATQSENSMNMRLSAKNTSGFKGVSMYKPSGKWMAYAKLGGKQYHLGYFHTAEAASAAYEAFAKQHHGEFYSPRIDALTAFCNPVTLPKQSSNL